MKLKLILLKNKDEDIDKNKNFDEEKNEVHETEDQKMARKIIYSYGIDNQSKVVKVNARAEKRER